MCTFYNITVENKEDRYGKGKLNIYIAPVAQVVFSKLLGMDHTVLPADYTIPALPS